MGNKILDFKKDSNTPIADSKSTFETIPCQFNEIMKALSRTAVYAFVGWIASILSYGKLAVVFYVLQSHNYHLRTSSFPHVGIFS
eukprot:gene8500-17532_t